ncbi:hypothetical protein [Opitutus sp. GAS368]|jgi:hypothetical protein|uniref:hypothetical protein n=1 Tax=Opitutus sp. GAS368 TaxID=1882749 RepID=UPI00087B77B6|nr:hypothetical protein [Opitutus sp. GAS368]SDR86918.1 hypothetical protein SAMN05444173_1164 [Opitutus sp. GAS368]
MKKFLAPFFLVASLALLAGCSSSNNITAGVKIGLTGLARASDGSTRVSWRVINPNVISYLVSQTTHRIYLNGVLIGTVIDREPLAVLPQAHSERTSPLASAGPAADSALAAAATAGSGAYRVESTIVVQLYGETTDKSNLTATGTVPVTAK